VVDEAAGAAVVEQVGELLGDVAVVDVERGDPGLEAAQVGDQVLGAVVEVEADGLLAEFVVGEFGPLCGDGEPLVDEVAAEASGPVLHLGVGEAHVALDEVVAVGDRLGDGPCEEGDVELGHWGCSGLVRR
jgi:hypothetical protein